MLSGSLLALFPDEELLGTLAKDLPFRRPPASTVVWDGCHQVCWSALNTVVSKVGVPYQGVTEVPLRGSARKYQNL